MLKISIGKRDRGNRLEKMRIELMGMWKVQRVNKLQHEGLICGNQGFYCCSQPNPVILPG